MTMTSSGATPEKVICHVAFASALTLIHEHTIG